jgi:hypothetical protein
MIISADIDCLMTQNDHFRWYWSSYHWKWSFLLILILLWLNKIILWYGTCYEWIRSFRDINPIMIENDHFVILIVLWLKMTISLTMILLWLKMIISPYLDRLFTDHDHFRWCWSSYDWTRSFRLILIVLWLTRAFPTILIILWLDNIISIDIESIMTEDDHFFWYWSS